MRRLGALLLILALAAMLNVLTAWACMLWAPFSKPTASTNSDGTQAGFSPSLTQTIEGTELYDWKTDAGFGVAIGQLDDLGFAGEGPMLTWSGTPTVYHRYHAGWPMLCLTSETWTPGWDMRNPPPPPETRWQSSLHRGFPANRLPNWLRPRPQRQLPLTPIPLPFAINTVLFALAMLPLLVLSRKFRANRLIAKRRRHGLCPQCGYDRRGNPAAPCPECGKTQPSTIA